MLIIFENKFRYFISSDFDFKILCNSSINETIWGILDLIFVKMHEKILVGGPEKKTRMVVLLTSVTMVIEIFFGYFSNSMALLADGWHMLSHTFALGLTWITYVLLRKYSTSENVSFNSQKLLSLTGFTSAIILQIIAVIMAIESVSRLIHPLNIKFGEAIFVAVIGLLVNLVSAVMLYDDHSDNDHLGKHKHNKIHDHNFRAAYIHVLADALTSVTAILALIAGLYFHFPAFDALSGILGSLVITKWTVTLLKASGSDLIDFKRVKRVL